MAFQKYKDILPDKYKAMSGFFHSFVEEIVNTISI